MASVGGFSVVFFSSFVGSVEDTGSLVVKKLVSFPKFGWRSRVADGDGFGFWVSFGGSVDFEAACRAVGSEAGCVVFEVCSTFKNEADVVSKKEYRQGGNESGPSFDSSGASMM